MDLIKDETDVGQVVRVTYDEGVEFLNYNDVRVNFILRTPFLNSMKRKVSLDTLEGSGYDELRLFLIKVVGALQTTKFVNTMEIVLTAGFNFNAFITLFRPGFLFCFLRPRLVGEGEGWRGSELPLYNFKTAHPTATKTMYNEVLIISSFWA